MKLVSAFVLLLPSLCFAGLYDNQTFFLDKKINDRMVLCNSMAATTDISNTLTRRGMKAAARAFAMYEEKGVCISTKEIVYAQCDVLKMAVCA